MFNSERNREDPICHRVRVRESLLQTLTPFHLYDSDPANLK